MDLAKLFSWEALVAFGIGMICGAASLCLFLSSFMNYLRRGHAHDDPADWWKRGNGPYED